MKIQSFNDSFQTAQLRLNKFAQTFRFDRFSTAGIIILPSLNIKCSYFLNKRWEKLNGSFGVFVIRIKNMVKHFYNLKNI